MEKSTLTKEKTNTQLNGVRKKSRKRFYESKEKNEKRVPTETEDLERVPTETEDLEKEFRLKRKT